MAEPPLGVLPGRICNPVMDDEPADLDPVGEDVIHVTFPDGRYGVKTLADLRHEKESANETIPGEQIGPGRPRKYNGGDLGQAQALVVGHANKALDDYPWALDLEGEAFWSVADAFLNVTLAGAEKANPKLLAQWLPMSKSTIYNRRKKGKGESAMLLEQLDRIENMVQRTAALVEDLHWAEQQRVAEHEPDYAEGDAPVE
jgi:hypothetical protein